jgi:tetratricopeptide (TPR) repeat protein
MNRKERRAKGKGREAGQAPPQAALASWLAGALDHHRAGRLDEAEGLYRQTLLSWPKNTDALRLLGVLLHQKGQPDQALDLIDQALAIQPRFPEAWINRGLVLTKLGRLDEAESALRKALDQSPGKVEPLVQLAALYFQQDRLVEAARHYEAALRLMPGEPGLLARLGACYLKMEQPLEAQGLLAQAQAASPDGGAALKPPRPLGAEALYATALLHHKAGRPQQAEAFYRQALAADPAHGPSLVNLAALLEERSALDEAKELLEQALKAAPGDATAAFNLGNVYQKLGRKGEAAMSWRRALRLDPAMADAAINLADHLIAAEQAQEAEACLRAHLPHAPGDTRLLNMLAKALKTQDRPEEALAILDQALLLAPADAKLLANRGGILRILERPAESWDCLARAVSLAPDYADAYFNLGNILRETGRLAPAVQAYDRLLALKPLDWEARWNRSIALLCQGRLEEGWADYELRWHESLLLRRYPQPLWDGASPLAGKTVFVWREQGVGDEITFASALPDLIAQAGHVILECSPKLAPLMRRSFPGITVTSQPPPCFDLHLPLGSLFHHFRSRIEDFPDRAAYLIPSAWKGDLGPGLKVGIAWRSTKITRERARHFFPDPLELAPVFQVKGVRFINLQARLEEGEIERIREATGVSLAIIPGLDLFDDLDGAAALISKLDLVISNGSVTAILAAALGVPTWMFYVDNVHWDRLGTDGIPWLPAMRLLSRQVGEPWTKAVGEAARKLSSRSNA